MDNLFWRDALDSFLLARASAGESPSISRETLLLTLEDPSGHLFQSIT
jgi:hypothetical protein